MINFIKVDLNKSIVLFLILLTCIFNQLTWVIFFDSNNALELSEIIIFGLFDILLLILATLCFFYGYKLIFFNLFLFLITLIIIELIFGNWFFKDKINHLNILKDYNVKFSIENLYDWHEKTINYTRDVYGLRSNYKSLDDIDIITIGGSTTDQRFIGEGFTYQDILHKLFLEEKKYVSVVNAGVDGQSTFGHIKNFHYWFKSLSSLNPKYFLFFIGVNDVYRLKPVEQDTILNQNREKLHLSLVNTIRSKSIFYYLIKLASGIHEAKVYELGHGYKKSYPKVDWTKEVKIDNHEYFVLNALDSFEDRLILLTKLVKEYNSKTIFVTQSHRKIYDFIDGTLFGEKDYLDLNGIKINGTDYYHIIRLMHQRMLKVAQNEGAIFLDLAEELEFDLDNDFYDHCHFTPSGAEKIGKYLHHNLRQYF